MVVAIHEYFVWSIDKILFFCHFPHRGLTLKEMMEGPLGSLSCPVEKNCLKWVEVYLKDCVCSWRDEVSLTLGLLSVFSWGVAEVPQILTNYKMKSTEGISLLFLMTWVVGDLFNVAGCYLEPATLPTQFYMALLYTITTAILVSQTIYYEHIRACLQLRPVDGIPEAKQVDTESQKPTGVSEGAAAPTNIRVPVPTKEFYFMSARSLASSCTPTPGTYSLVGSHGAGSYIGSHQSGSYLQEPSSLFALNSGHSRRGGSHKLSASGLIRMAASAGTLLVGSMGLSAQFAKSAGLGAMLKSSVGQEITVKGEVFGWIMAAIYMGGRVPQIWLNMQRGSVEGLNPMMFMFALVGNLTYVGSILVRSLDWSQLKPNLPWLVDAAVCVLLDCFILCQFGYYYRKQSREVNVQEPADEHGVYKPLE